MGDASLLALATIHGRAPSSISKDLPNLKPVLTEKHHHPQYKTDKKWHLLVCQLLIKGQVPQIGADNLHCKEWMVDIPCAAPRDSHFAKLAIPLATWASTSGCRDRTIPRSARIPPSSLSFSCSLSGIHPKDNPQFGFEKYTKRHYKASPTGTLFSYNCRSMLRPL